MSCNTTDISSEIDITAVETNAFDKQELIVWASKLELESIDYRTSSINLMQQLSTVSNSLTTKLREVNQHMYELKKYAKEEDIKLKTFIDYTISEELDTAYEKITYLSAKFNDLQKIVHQLDSKDEKIQDLEYKFDAYVRKQNKKNLNYETRIKELDQLNETILKDQKSSTQLTTQLNINQERFSRYIEEQNQRNLNHESRIKELENLIINMKNQKPNVLSECQQKHQLTNLIENKEGDSSTVLNKNKKSLDEKTDHCDPDDNIPTHNKTVLSQPAVNKPPPIVQRYKRRSVTRVAKKESSTQPNFSKQIRHQPTGRKRGRPKTNATRMLIFD